MLNNTKNQGPFPVESLKRVEHPTTLVTDEIQRIDMRDTAYGLASRGEFGPTVQKDVQKNLPDRYPFSASQKNIIDHISIMEQVPVAQEKAPISSDPAILTSHIKAAGYFLKADIMGTCKVPQSAFYSHDKQGHEIEARDAHAILIIMRKDWKTVNASSGYDWAGDPRRPVHRGSAAFCTGYHGGITRKLRGAL